MRVLVTGSSGLASELSANLAKAGHTVVKDQFDVAVLLSGEPDELKRLDEARALFTKKMSKVVVVSTLQGFTLPVTSKQRGGLVENYCELESKHCDVVMVRLGRVFDGEKPASSLKVDVPLLGAIAKADALSCLVAAITAPLTGFRVVHGVGPAAYAEESVEDISRAWFNTGATQVAVNDADFEWKATETLTVAVKKRPVYLVIGKKVKEQAAWLSMAADLTAATRLEKGCEFYDFVKVGDDAFFILERWASRSELAAHCESAHFKKFVPKMDAISVTTSFEECTDALDTSSTVGVMKEQPVFLIIHKTTKDAKWLEMAKELARESRKEQGCVYYEFLKSADGFVIVERWASKAELEVHAASPHFTRLVPAMDLISETPAFSQGAECLPAVQKKYTNKQKRVGRILILYDSSTSCTARMAVFIKEGCLQLDRTEVRVRTVGGSVNSWDKKQPQSVEVVEEACHEDLLWADGVCCGTPTNLGCVSWRMKKFWDDFSQAGHWAMIDGRVGCSFSSVGGHAGGAEIVCMAMNAIMMNFGFSVFGVTDYVGFKDTLHYGAVVAKAPREPVDRMVCRRLGVRLAEFVGYYIVHRPEAHPMLASKKRDLESWGGPIPARGGDLAVMEAENAAPLNLADNRPRALLLHGTPDATTPAAAALIADLARGRGYKTTFSTSQKADVTLLLSGSADDEKRLLEGNVLFLRSTATSAAVAGVIGARASESTPLMTRTARVDVAAVEQVFGCEFRDSAIAGLPPTFDIDEELLAYDLKTPKNATVLVWVGDQAVVWCSENNGKRFFYCGLGASAASYDDDTAVSAILEAGFAFLAPSTHP